MRQTARTVARAHEMIDATTPRIRVALLLDDLVQPAWAARAISELLESDSIEVALVVLNDAPSPVRARFHRVRSWIRNRNFLAYALYQRFDRWRFKLPNDPFADVDMTAVLGNIPARRVRPRMTKHCDYFEPADVDAIREFDIDVAARFGFRILKGDALEIAKHGVWSYHHGDNLVNRGGPAGFWEVMEGSKVTGCVLQRLTESLDDGVVLYRAFSATNRFSVRKNQSGFFWSSAPILRRVLEQLHRDGPEAVFDRDRVSPGWHGYSNRLYVAPTNREMIPLFARVLQRYVGEKVRAATSFDQWFIAYRLRSEAPVDRFRPDSNYYRFLKLIPPPDRFWADPFAVSSNGRHYIFLEEFIFRTDRGRISLFEIDAKGVAEGPVPVLERDYHLSYPFMFEWDNQHYMVPETHASGQIELFRATSFPREWTLDRILVPNVRAVDATIAQIGDRWWLFASVSPHAETEWDDLHIYYADSPLGPWTPHRRNPVKSDVRSARPAGRVFCANGKYFRPAQDSAERYGHSIVINEIVRIDPDEFVEVEVSRISPNWTDRLLATHTINADGRLTVIDGQLSRRGRQR